MDTRDFDYELPARLIAQEPSPSRDAARLLVHRLAEGRTEHRAVRDLPELLSSGDLLVVNDARVLPARLFARRASGGRVELLFFEALGPGRAGERWLALARPARKLREGEELGVEGAPERLVAAARRPRPDGEPGPEWEFELSGGGPGSVAALLERVGRVPLPPYIARATGDELREVSDRERYQTVFAREPVAVAAPTAGLHFTPELLGRLAARGVERAAITLEVGPGTFRPVESERVEDHVMHSERFRVPQATAAAIRACRDRGGRVVAVGTTVVRTLEAAAAGQGCVRAGEGRTDLFLRPGAEFGVVDALLTNFHLPRSTLLMLVAAFAGRERVLGLYAEAITLGYRFYSYGDAMLLLGPGRAVG